MLWLPFWASLKASVDLKAPLASPTFTGTVTVPTLAVTTASAFPTGTWTPTVTPGGGSFTASGSGAWWKEGAYTEYEATITIAAVGTGTGVVRFTLPTTPSADGHATGVEFLVNGKLIAVTVTSGSPSAFFTNYDNSSPIVAGTKFVISGRYKT